MQIVLQLKHAFFSIFFPFISPAWLKSDVLNQVSFVFRLVFKNATVSQVAKLASAFSLAVFLVSTNFFVQVKIGAFFKSIPEQKGLIIFAIFYAAFSRFFDKAARAVIEYLVSEPLANGYLNLTNHFFLFANQATSKQDFHVARLMADQSCSFIFFNTFISILPSVLKLVVLNIYVLFIFGFWSFLGLLAFVIFYFFHTLASLPGLQTQAIKMAEKNIKIFQNVDENFSAKSLHQNSECIIQRALQERTFFEQFAIFDLHQSIFLVMAVAILTLSGYVKFKVSGNVTSELLSLFFIMDTFVLQISVIKVAVKGLARGLASFAGAQRIFGSNFFKLR